MKKETKIISENPQKGKKYLTRQVVVQTIVTGKKNRVGDPYKTSVTKHIRIKKTKKQIEEERNAL
tara:strand:- start:188 stop:382 length:195 start_codon:yes stop_codon:yes gene_type:complete